MTYSLSEFEFAARDGGIVPVTRTCVLDADSPVGVLAKLRRGPYAFLLESLVGGERWARYTFVGTAPREVWRYRSGHAERWTPAAGWSDGEPAPDPIAHLQRILPAAGAGGKHLPRFFGGAVGVWSYDIVRTIEQLPNVPQDDVGTPDALVMIADTLVILDNLYGQATLVANVETDSTEDGDTRQAQFAEAQERLDELERRLRQDHGLQPLSAGDPRAEPEALSTFERNAFEQGVRRIKEHITDGDCFQVVLSRRQDVGGAIDALTFYRHLRALNPAPYLFYLEFDDITVVGSSPEVLVRVEDGEVTVRPIAGTRPRGASPDEDQTLAADMASDEKELAEHRMLVDLGRNDVGRVAEFGSVRVTESMVVERYSHVQHLVSEVRGRLRQDMTALDALRSCFPAGTVSGAPKVRAMEIIDDLEPIKRGIYAGAVGYVGWGGRSLDTAIAIRTAVVLPDRTLVQAGAGIVADSDPAREYDETQAKAGALLGALASTHAAR